MEIKVNLVEYSPTRFDVKTEMNLREQHLNDITTTIYHLVCELTEKRIRDQLIKLGWTPPEEL